MADLEKTHKRVPAEVSKLIQGIIKEAIKLIGFYRAMVRYDIIVIMEAQDEKIVMKNNNKINEIVSTETLGAMMIRETEHIQLLGNSMNN